MPAYKDKNGKWFCKFYYKDYSGERKQKKKSGFDLRKEALAWERDFIENHAAVNNDISFDTLVNKYLVDLKARTRKATYERVLSMAKHHIFGVFNCSASEITPLMVKEWQYSLKDKGLASSTIRKIVDTLSGIFNWGISFCGLQKNPVRIAKNIVPKEKREYVILTRQQYEQLEFPNAKYKVLFDVLFYTGLRFGECLALTVGDIEGKNISVTKSRDREKVIAAPKTQNSIRNVLMPKFLADEVQKYIKTMYKAEKTDLLFDINRSTAARPFKAALRECGFPEMRIHDLRHSHASMMIELGCNILLVAERLGDTPETALATYSHLYPGKQEEFVSMIE